MLMRQNWSFNSKLVRLEEIVMEALRHLTQSCFNSKLVRLEETAIRYLNRYCDCFNSKLVRLEAYP